MRVPVSPGSCAARPARVSSGAADGTGARTARVRLPEVRSSSSVPDQGRYWTLARSSSAVSHYCGIATSVASSTLGWRRRSHSLPVSGLHRGQHLHQGSARGEAGVGGRAGRPDARGWRASGSAWREGGFHLRAGCHCRCVPRAARAVLEADNQRLVVNYSRQAVGQGDGYTPVAAYDGCRTGSSCWTSRATTRPPGSPPPSCTPRCRPMTAPPARGFLVVTN